MDDLINVALIGIGCAALHSFLGHYVKRCPDSWLAKIWRRVQGS